MAALEVLALNTTTPQIMAPQSGDTYTFPRAVEMPLGTANGVLYLNGSKVVTSGSGLVFDSSGNLGLGVTPSAWSTAYRALDMGTGAIMAQASGTDTYYTQNAIFGLANTWVYKANGLASRYQQVTGVHSWHNAPSGTAGNAISFTQALTLTAASNLLLGGTNDPRGANAFYIANTASVPGTPTSGGVLYVESGALKYKGSSGTVTTIANA